MFSKMVLDIGGLKKMKTLIPIERNGVIVAFKTTLHRCQAFMHNSYENITFWIGDHNKHIII